MSDDDDDLDALAEKEIAMLQRQYRIIEGERRKFVNESELTISKQKKALIKLQEEKEEIRRNLMVAQSKKNVIKDAEYMEDLGQLLHEQDFFKKLIKEEKDAIKALDEEVARLQQEVVNQNKLLKGISSTDRTKSIEKQLRLLENRLEKATKDFNKMVTSNKKLREEIDHLRTQRSSFDDVYNKLNKKLNDQKKAMQVIIDESQLAYDARDDVTAKMQALKEKNEKDLLNYQKEYRELLRIIDHDSKLKNFMNTKAVDRLGTNNSGAGSAKRRSVEMDKSEKQALAMIEKYEAAFKKIQEITGQEDMYAVVKKFLETEEKSYAIFTYINELNTELRIIDDEIEATRQEIREFNEKGVDHQTERQKVLHDLEDKLEETLKQEKKFDAQIAETEAVLEQLKEGVGKVFADINCDGSVLQQALGDQSTVNDDNILTYLSLIEQKTNELLQVHAYLQLKELEKGSSGEKDGEVSAVATAVLGGPAVPPKDKPVQIQIPIFDEVKDDDEGDSMEEFDKPLSMEELKKRANKLAVKMEQEMAG